MTKIGVIVLGSILCGCWGAMQWSYLDAAESNMDKHSILSPISVQIDGKEFSASYNELIKDGVVDPSGSGEVLGQLYDQYGNKLYGNNDEGTRSSWKMISNNPDFVSILKSGDKLYAVAHYETPLPSSVYVLELQQSSVGELSVLSFFYLNASQYDGIWNPCAGSVSPWNTHLGSEEYSPNGRLYEQSTTLEDFISEDKFHSEKVVQYMKFYGLYPKWVNMYNIKQNFHPYLFGYPWEVSFNADNTYSIVKHMSMGRLSIELPKVMPDNRTVYITSDGTNKPLVMFKAKRAGDLSAGDLYAAKFVQADGVGGGNFLVEWIDLGYAEDGMLFPVARTTMFSDLFEYQKPMMYLYPENGGCGDGYTSVNVNIAHECLKVIPGMEMFASRFETERYAAVLGATTEFRKWEGITYSQYDNKIYTSLSEVKLGMEDFSSKGKPSKSYDFGGPNDVRLQYNECGCVYSMDMNADYVATSMNGFLCGEANSPSAPDFEENECRLDKIASPDNIAAVDGHAGLLIAEDADGHQNNILWYYDLKQDQMTRILSGPYGCEITGAYFHPNINGFSYIMAQIQHPYGQRDQHKISEPESFGRNAVIGYFGPFPATNGDENLQFVASAGVPNEQVAAAQVPDVLEAAGQEVDAGVSNGQVADAQVPAVLEAADQEVKAAAVDPTKPVAAQPASPQVPAASVDPTMPVVAQPASLQVPAAPLQEEDASSVTQIDDPTVPVTAAKTSAVEQLQSAAGVAKVNATTVPAPQTTTPAAAQTSNEELSDTDIMAYLMQRLSGDGSSSVKN